MRPTVSLVTEAAAWMGGIDVVLYLSGSSPLVRVADAPASLWHEMLATNLVGAAVVVRGASTICVGPTIPSWS